MMSDEEWRREIDTLKVLVAHLTKRVEELGKKRKRKKKEG